MRRFEKEDYTTIKEWFIRRNAIAPSPEFLPPIGMIEDATACGFLIKTDTPIALLEYFVTNPFADKHVRLSAISDIALSLSDIARKDGARLIVCNTKYENIRTAATKQNFSYVGDFSTFYKELEPWAAY